jgi:hypothetical protein
VARRSSRLSPFVIAAAVLVTGGLLMLRPLLEVRPTKLTLRAGTQKKIAASHETYAEIWSPARKAPVRIERDERHRVIVHGEREGIARLSLFENARLRRLVDIEVTRPPLRKIEVTPDLRELFAKKDPPRRPKRRRERRKEITPEEPVAAQRTEPLELTPLMRLPKPENPRTPKPQDTQKKLARPLAAPTPLPSPTPTPAPTHAATPKHPEPPKDTNKKMVELDAANRKKPTDAKYLAQEDSAVEKETRATKTTLVKTKPGDEQPNEVGQSPNPGTRVPKLADTAETAPNEAERRRRGRKKIEAIEPIVASPAPTPTPQEEPRETRILTPDRNRRAPQSAPAEGTLGDRGREIVDDFPTGPPRRIRLFPSSLQIARILRQYPGPAPRPGRRGQEAEEGDDETGAPSKGRSRMATRMPGGSAKWRKIWQRVQGFLENFIPEVQPGTHTALNAQKSAFAAFIAAAHRKIHVQWGFGLWNSFRTLGSYHPGYNAVYNRLEIKLNRRGKVLRIGLVRTSGRTDFDGATMASVLASAPFGKPPESMVSRDGIVYVHWTFFQDGRQCWTNDVQIFVNDERQH